MRSSLVADLNLVRLILVSNGGSLSMEAIACSRTIFECVVAYNVPLELNGSGFHKPLIKTNSGKRPVYPLTPFWELAKGYPITIVTSSDPHTPKTVKAHADDARTFANEIGLAITTSIVIDHEMKMTRENSVHNA